MGLKAVTATFKCDECGKESGSAAHDGVSVDLPYGWYRLAGKVRGQEIVSVTVCTVECGFKIVDGILAKYPNECVEIRRQKV